MRLGILGFSEGNGHPYSWAAIFNGYCPTEMAESGFPVISAYLANQRYPDDFISGASVTHIWTQDFDLSSKISRASKIKNICNNPEEMIGEVDGVLLARDDAESHYTLAAPFLRAGIPVYIDKPFVLSLATAEKIRAEARYPWQIFTCSALYYARELRIAAELKTIGKLKSVYAVTPQSWETYGAHLLDPVLRQISGNPLEVQGWKLGSATHVFARWSDDITTHFHATGSANSAIRIHYIGESGELLTIFEDSFSAFKSALEEFVRQIRQSEEVIPSDHVSRVVSMLEAGCAVPNLS
ncbi:Gfo/Idh/MocA family oxidoreductase [bacterium]|nr:Gfo/Idh/MocA family oxidoreductase [bacterium]